MKDSKHDLREALVIFHDQRDFKNTDGDSRAFMICVSLEINGTLIYTGTLKLARYEGSDIHSLTTEIVNAKDFSHVCIINAFRRLFYASTYNEIIYSRKDGSVMLEGLINSRPASKYRSTRRYRGNTVNTIYYPVFQRIMSKEYWNGKEDYQRGFIQYGDFVKFTLSDFLTNRGL